MHTLGVISWGGFKASVPDLAAFGAGRLAGPPSYMATIRDDGRPRVHPVTPIISDTALFVFMEPTSPKGRDLRQRGWYAVHNGVPDMSGTGGEFFLSGKAVFVDDPDIRATAVAAAVYDPAERYILFELRIVEARCNGYGDVTLPEPKRWVDDTE
jgi:hypothetical protein